LKTHGRLESEFDAETQWLASTPPGR